MTDYDAVFWDVGGVLLDVSSVREAHAAFVERLLAENDIDATADESLDVWRNVVGRHFRERDGTEFRSARTAYGLAVDEVLARDVPEDEWFPLFRATVREHLRPNPGAREVTARLADAGVYQGIVSDADADEGEFILEHLEVREHVDDVTTSEAVGRTKPDLAMFEAALEKSPIPAEGTVMVGDRYEHDMAGAARHGIHPVSHGAEDGSAVEYVVDDPRGVLAVVGVDD
ncbi:HAD family hydrolase [Haladaptatus halobius]|uniref:HAD family hydrolase n=1 Tax=Haladaptatus halobius TaxID=2884875 RepID=UPI001D0B8AD4|nr:HAD family hydrolase [Haladaptatus halobius]